MWSRAEELVSAALEGGVMPGCAVCVRTANEVLWVHEAGAAELRPRHRPVAIDQVWDLASLTKVLATVPLCLSLVSRGDLSLDTEVRAVLGHGPPDVRIRHLLQHSSGLAAWRPLFDEVVEAGDAWGTVDLRERIYGAALASRPRDRPGASHAYSDLGFLVLGAVLEAVGGARIDQLWSQQVVMSADADLRWGWPGAAATEDCPLRGRVVVGEVHDLNAAVMGGRAPHAGLFGSVRGVAAAAAWQLRAFQGHHEGLPPGLVRQAFCQQGPGSHRLGWDGVTPGASTAGPRWPLDGVGHTGFTGCTLWIAPRQGIVVAMLSNRVHPEIEGGAVPGAPVTPRLAAFRAFRPALHTAIVDALEADGRWS